MRHNAFTVFHPVADPSAHRTRDSVDRHETPLPSCRDLHVEFRLIGRAGGQSAPRTIDEQNHHTHFVLQPFL